MNNLTKVILAVVAVVLVACLATAAVGFFIFRSGGRLIANSLETDSGKVAQVSNSIAEFSVPEGFGSPYAAHILGFSVVGYTGADHHSHIYFAQLPKLLPVDRAEIEAQLRQATFGPTYDRTTKMTVVDRQATTIRGQDVTLLVSEGTNSNGDSFREVTGLFDGNGGQVLVVYETPIQSWDQAEVDAFLASIH